MSSKNGISFKKTVRRGTALAVAMLSVCAIGSPAFAAGVPAMVDAGSDIGSANGSESGELSLLGVQKISTVGYDVPDVPALSGESEIAKVDYTPEKKRQMAAEKKAAEEQRQAEEEARAEQQRQSQNTVSAPQQQNTSAPVSSPKQQSNPQRTVDNSSIVSTAKSVLGVPYVYGGSTPSGFDCSGFTQWVFAQHGISIPRVSSAQQYAGSGVSAGSIQAGDLVTWAGHTGIYVGNDTMIHAPVPGQTVSYVSYSAMVAAMGTPSIRRF